MKEEVIVIIKFLIFTARLGKKVAELTLYDFGQIFLTKDILDIGVEKGISCVSRTAKARSILTNHFSVN